MVSGMVAKDLEPLKRHLTKKARREWAEREVMKRLSDGWSGDAFAMGKNEAMDMLTKAHARAVQVVKARDKWLLGGGYDNMSPDFQAGYHQACHHILADMQKGRA